MGEYFMGEKCTIFQWIFMGQLNVHKTTIKFSKLSWETNQKGRFVVSMFKIVLCFIGTLKFWEYFGDSSF